jgi:phage/plasmid-like protein (TIGR03299 family)
MSANIEMNVDGSARLAYVGESPWHKMGYRFLTPPTSVEEVGSLTHATALVRAQPLFAQIGFKSAEVDGQTVQVPNYVLCEDRQAIVRVEDGHLLASVGAGYHPIQAIDVFKQAQPAIDEGFLTIETMGVIDEGRRPWMQCRINNTTADIVANDTVNAYILFFLSHDGTLVAGSTDTAIRVVCQNTLNASLGEAFGRAIKIRHTKNGVAKIKDIGTMIAAKQASFQLSVEALRAMARRKIDASEFKGYIANVFADEIDTRTSKKNATAEEKLEAAAKAETAVKNLHGEILPLFENGVGSDIPGVRGTVWAALNSVTEYLTHFRGRTADNRLNSLAFGRGAQTNQNAFIEAVKLAA